MYSRKEGISIFISRPMLFRIELGMMTRTPVPAGRVQEGEIELSRRVYEMVEGWEDIGPGS
jgi:hypothetical protein